jgi:hypothetical protein
MQLLSATSEHAGDRVRMTAAIGTAAGQRVEPYIEYAVAEPARGDAAADAFAAALLLPAMRAGESLEVTPPIAHDLWRTLPRIRDVFHTWWPAFPRIDVVATPTPLHVRDTPERAATFFSGGIDSFYTLLKHRHDTGSAALPLTHVVFMRGVETRLDWIRNVEDSESWIRSIAGAAGVQCILGETDMRTSLQGPETNLNWEKHYHGSALAAIALGLSPWFRYVCIPSAYSYRHLVAHGSTPLVDEMYSTEHLRVLHDGGEVSRAEKVAKIIGWDADLVLAHLRVCIWNRGGAYNCGKCYKCVRTAVPLKVLGVWEAARTFRERSTSHWERVMAEDHPALTEENLRFARDHGADARLVSALKGALARRRRKDWLTGVLKNSPVGNLLPAALRVKSALGSN